MQADWREQTWSWFDAHPVQQRMTEITVAVLETIAPSWTPDKGGGWCAQLDTTPSLNGQAIAECDHWHPNEGEAWACAELLALKLALEVVKGRQ